MIASRRPNVEDWLERAPADGWLRHLLQQTELGSYSMVLDVGCGAGFYSKEMASAGCTVVSVDLERECVEACADAGLARPLQASVTALPFQDDLFDYVLMRYVLHQVPRPWQRQALREVHRVLRPGGTLILESTDATHARPNHDIRLFPPLMQIIEQMYPALPEIQHYLQSLNMSCRVEAVEQHRPDYESVSEAMKRSQLLVDCGQGPTPWLLLSQQQRLQFHADRSQYLRELYGDGRVPRSWFGFQLFSEKNPC